VSCEQLWRSVPASAPSLAQIMITAATMGMGARSQMRSLPDARIEWSARQFDSTLLQLHYNQPTVPPCSCLRDLIATATSAPRAYYTDASQQSFVARAIRHTLVVPGSRFINKLPASSFPIVLSFQRILSSPLINHNLPLSPIKHRISPALQQQHFSSQWPALVR
jgi:hypothetical protein